jgi:hypothetical protein
MPYYPHENWGDIQNYIFIKGIITAVQSDEDTADVTVPGGSDGSGVPIFYHCSDDAEERDNGAIEGGSAAFSFGTADDPTDGDEVMVMCKADTGIPVRIIGFVDGIKSCEVVWILIKVGGSYSLFDPVTDSLVEGLKTDAGVDVEWPIPGEWTGDPATSVWWTDYADYLENDKWQSLWKSHEDYGTWWVRADGELVGRHPHTHMEPDLTVGFDDEYDYLVSYDPPYTTIDYMLNNTAFGENETPDSPANGFFSGPLTIKLDRYRELHRYISDSPDTNESLFQIQWDDEKTYDDCPFLVAKNVVVGDDEYSEGTHPEEVKFATRYKEEDFHDLTNLIVIKDSDPIDVNDCDLQFKTYKKKTVLEIEPPEGYLEDAFVEEEVEIYYKYVERKQPWDFDDFEKDVIPITPWKENKYTNIYASTMFQTHPNWQDVLDAYPWTPSSELANSNAWPYTPWNNRYSRADSYKPPVFQGDDYFSDQLHLASCVKESDWETYQENMFKGEDGCSGWADDCEECTEPSDSGQMYDLHQAYRGDNIVPVAAISAVCQTLAEEINSGAHGYDHDGFDSRVAEILSQLDCVQESMGENLARVPVTVGPGTPEEPNPPYDPVDAAFSGYTYGSGAYQDGWVDSPEHEANLSDSNWTMMGYGSSGEYHVTIFGALTWACKNNDRWTSYSVMKVSDFTKENTRIQMGLDPGEPFPAEVATPDYLPPGWVGKGYMALPSAMFPTGATGWASLEDGKIRVSDSSHVKFDSSIFCDDEDEIPGIINVAIGYPFTRFPTSLLVERDSDSVRDSIKVHASHDIKLDCDTKQRPVEMGRSTNFEDAILDVAKMDFDRNLEDNGSGKFGSLEIKAVRPNL